MDLNTIPWDIRLIFFAAGCIAGGIIFSIILIPSRRRNEESVEELDKKDREFTAYRENVTDHFNKTAELVNTMTESYRSVYRHLADGAQNLCDEQLSKPAVQFTESKLVEQTKEPVIAAAEALKKTEAESPEYAEPVEQAETETIAGEKNKASGDTAESTPETTPEEQVEEVTASTGSAPEFTEEPVEESATNAETTSRSSSSEEEAVKISKDNDTAIAAAESSATPSKEVVEEETKEKA